MDCSFQPTCFDNEAVRHPLKFSVLVADNLMNARGRILGLGQGFFRSMHGLVCRFAG